MPVTVAANFLSVSHKGSNGTSMAFPDVCKTPSPAGPIPIPYPNIAMSAQLTKGTTTVKVDGQMAAIQGCKIAMTSGDEAGSAGGGVVSSKIKGEAEFVNFSFNVKLDGKGVCRMLDPTTQNAKNTVGPAHLQAPVV